VSAWTTAGDVPDATVRLQATPGAGRPEFSFGCGSHDGTASCDLGAMDAKSAPRQLQATLTVPVSALAVTSARLTVIGSAAKLAHDPEASMTVTITDPPSAAVITSPLAVGSLPGIPVASPSLSPGGSAANLFPKLDPSATPSASANTPARTRAVANTRALPEATPVVGAQLLGLAALGLAFVLAVTRLSIRRRPAAVKAAPGASQAGSGPGQEAGAATLTAAGSAAEDEAGTEDEPAEIPEPAAEAEPTASADEADAGE
jgi:hypothetical protein